MRTLLFILGLLGAPAFAGVEAGLRAGVEQLDGALDDWRMTRLDLGWRGESGSSAWFQSHQVERFGIDDDEMGFGLYRRFDEVYGVTLEHSRGGDAGLLPEQAWRLALHRKFDAGWIAHLGARSAVYRNDDVSVLDAGVERYVGDWRAALTVYRGAVDGLNERGHAAMLAFDRYYGDGSRIGMSFAGGREVERIGPLTALITGVSDAGLGGQHWFGSRYGVAWRLAWHEQGALYTRTGVEVGLLVRF